MRCGFGFVLKVIEDLLECLPRERSECFGYKLEGAAAFTTRLDVNVEYPLEALRRGHSREVFAVRRKHLVKAGQVYPGLGHQSHSR